jgi:hypothetical protein
MDPPAISVGTPEEYDVWEQRMRKFLQDRFGSSVSLERVDARYNYRSNRISLYRLADPADPGSVAETLSHETLHALLYQMGEEWAARMIDLVGKRVGDPLRRGGI